MVSLIGVSYQFLIRFVQPCILWLEPANELQFDLLRWVRDGNRQGVRVSSGPGFPVYPY